MVSLIAFYLVFLVLFSLYSTAGLYHLRRFGYAGDLTQSAIVLYLFLALLVVGGSFAFIIPLVNLG